MSQIVQYELAQGYELLFKSFGLWFIKGPTPEGKKLLQQTLLFAQSQYLSETNMIEKISITLESEIPDREYAELFCVGNSSLSLYESVWKTGLVMQEARDEALMILNSLKLSLNPSSNEPEDHAGILLYAFGEILWRLTNAKEMSEKEKYEKLFGQTFEHLAWLKPLAVACQQREGGFHADLLKIAMQASERLAT